MQIFNYGNPSSAIVLIQPVDDHDMGALEAEIAEIKDQVQTDFQLMAVKVDDWNYDLSPWKAPAVLGKDDFGAGAEDTLRFILEQCMDRSKTYYLGGYSLAGLFSLWAAYQTDVFSGIAAASPSIWFPDFLHYMKEHEIRTDAVYLSLGDREEKTRNPVMATVGDCIREGHDLLQSRGIRTTLEWNPGNHFKDAEIRTAKAFAWVIKNDQEAEE